ncbi:MAG: hypothetical protein U0736_10075 [Gemmataceae bacterium]
MRTLSLAVGFVALTAAVRADPPVDYRVEVDPRSVFSTMRDLGGRSVRPGRPAVPGSPPRRRPPSPSVPPEEIRVTEDGRPVDGLQVFQPRVQQLSLVLAAGHLRQHGRRRRWTPPGKRRCRSSIDSTRGPRSG